MKWRKIVGILGRANKKSIDQPSKNVTVYPSLDLAFNLTQQRINNQQDRLVGLDTKANFALGAATGLVSAALVLQSLLLSSHSNTDCSIMIPQFLLTLPPLLKKALPLIPLLTAYLVVMALGLYSYKTRTIIRVPRPRTIFNLFLNESEAYTKKLVLEAMIDAYETNETKLNEKAKLIDYALVFLVIEAFSLVLLLLYEVIC